MPRSSDESATAPLRHTSSSALQELWTRQGPDHLQHHKNWEADRTNIISRITRTGNWTRHTPCSASQYLTRHTCIFNIKSSRCYYSNHHHHHHCHNHQLKAVSFVGTVGVAVTHIILVDNISRLCSSSSPLDTRIPLNSKQIAFTITCIYIHRHCIRLYFLFHSPVPSLHSSFIVIFIHLHHHCQAPFS